MAPILATIEFLAQTLCDPWHHPPNFHHNPNHPTTIFFPFHASLLLPWLLLVAVLPEIEATPEALKKVKGSSTLWPQVCAPKGIWLLGVRRNFAFPFGAFGRVPLHKSCADPMSIESLGLHRPRDSVCLTRQVFTAWPASTFALPLDLGSKIPYEVWHTIGSLLPPND